MALTLEDMLDGLRNSRRHFLKHLDGLTEEQWDWQPYPECKTIRVTLAHLIQDDRAALEALQKNGHPDYEASAVTERDLTRLRTMLDELHQALLTYLETHYAEGPLDTIVHAYGWLMKLGRAIGFLSSEDYYHAGQVAYIRLATDPTWDYYTVMYGEE